MVEQIKRNRYPHLPAVLLSMIGLPCIGAIFLLRKRPSLRSNYIGAKIFGILFFILNIPLILSLFSMDFVLSDWLFVFFSLVFPLFVLFILLISLPNMERTYREDADHFWRWLIEKNGSCSREELNNFPWKGRKSFVWIKDYPQLLLDDLKKNRLLEHQWDGNQLCAHFLGITQEEAALEPKTWSCPGCGAENTMKNVKCEYCGLQR